jgi:molybdenum cofactor synthesis domain-containing protein
MADLEHDPAPRTPAEALESRASADGSAPGRATDGAPARSTPTAGILLVGNELLTGKIRDENGWYLARWLRQQGIALQEIAVVPDADAAIGEALLRLCRRCDLVFTAGGVGPTHDDRTLAAVAAATDRPLQRHPEMEAVLRAHFGAALQPAVLALADLPQGTVPRATPGWPALRLDLPERACRVYLLPGVPELLRAKLERLADDPSELPRGTGWTLVTVEVPADETQLVAELDEVVAAFPDVEIGSYPRWEEDEAGGPRRPWVRLTLEAPEGWDDRVMAARAALMGALQRFGPR